MKPWYKSRLLWVNGLTLLSGVGMLIATEVTSDGQPLVPPRVAAWIALIIVPAANMALRMVTDQGIQR